MRLLRVGVTVALCGLVLSACRTRDPLFCDEDTPCEDPARPFCDLAGAYPGSEGIGKTCIPWPFDAGPHDATPASDAVEQDGVADGTSDAGVPSVLRLAAGSSHTCAIITGGRLRCWGNNDYGQLGYGHTNNIGDDEFPRTAGDVEVGAEVLDVALGEGRTCALLANKRVKCWGRNGSGELGYGNKSHVTSKPVDVGYVDLGGDVVALAANYQHTCAILSGGAVRCWGVNGSSGRLGIGNNEHIGDDEVPAAVDPVLLGGEALELALGYTHTCALLTTEVVRCWGSGFWGKLGYGNTQTIGDEPGEMPPPNVDIGATPVAIGAGVNHTCVLTAGKGVRCWGQGDFGQLGYGNTSEIGDTSTPAAAGAGDVSLGGPIASISIGQGHSSCAVLENGAVRCWGGGINGQLGLGDTEAVGDNELPSSKSVTPIGDTVESVASGVEHRCALLSSGAVRCWGRNNRGQLGYGHTQDIGDDETPSSAGNVQILDP